MCEHSFRGSLNYHKVVTSISLGLPPVSTLGNIPPKKTILPHPQGARHLPFMERRKRIPFDVHGFITILILG
jgi:hypothetical protein